MQHQLQLEIGAGQLVMAQQTGGRLVQMYQSRAQYAELVKLPPFRVDSIALDLRDSSVSLFAGAGAAIAG